MLTELTKDNFDQFIGESSIPVLVDFWAEWCGPCRMLAPILEEIAEELDGQVSVCKLNVDADGEIAARYGVNSIPTLICFSEGEPSKTVVGFRPKADVLSSLGFR